MIPTTLKRLLKLWGSTSETLSFCEISSAYPLVKAGASLGIALLKANIILGEIKKFGWREEVRNFVYFDFCISTNHSIFIDQLLVPFVKYLKDFT